MPELPSLAALFNSPPEAIVAQFRKKGYAISWNWQEVWQEANAHAFTVAKATDMEVLTVIREAVDDALANGTTFPEFQKNLEPKLKERGWWGRQEVVDPETGEVTEVQLGSPHRLKTIYRTNLSVSYSAGRYQAQIASAERRPWWVYRTAGDQNVRPSHDALKNTVLRYDDPFWDAHYPPNDWGCRCGVDSLSDRQLEKRKLKPTTGDKLQPFASKGWDFNPAKAVWQPLTDDFAEDLARKYVGASLNGPGLGVMYDRTNRLVQSLRQQGLDEIQIIEAFKNRGKKETFPVAVLEQPIREAIGAKGHSVYLTAETLAKQLIMQQQMAMAEYRKLQTIFEEAQLVIKKSESTLQFFYRESDEIFKSVTAVLKVDALHVDIFERLENTTAEILRKTGEVLKDEL